MSPFGGETVSQCRMVIARRLSGVVAISCIRLLRRLLQSLLLLRNDITTQPEGEGGGYHVMRSVSCNRSAICQACRVGLPEEQFLQFPPPAFHATSAGGGKSVTLIYIFSCRSNSLQRSSSA